MIGDQRVFVNLSVDVATRDVIANFEIERFKFPR